MRMRLRAEIVVDVSADSEAEAVDYITANLHLLSIPNMAVESAELDTSIEPEAA